MQTKLPAGSQNEIAPRKTVPGEKHVRPPAEFAAIKSAGDGPVFRPPQKNFAGGRKFLNVQLSKRSGQHATTTTATRMFY